MNDTVCDSSEKVKRSKKFRGSSIGVELWSALTGWGLRVEDCHSHHQPLRLRPHSLRPSTGCHPRPLVSQGYTLGPDQVPSRSPVPEKGITLSILNQRKPYLIFHKVFALGSYWAHWADLEWHLDRVAPGRIVVMTVAVSGTMGLRHAAQCLAKLGSLMALHLTHRAHWTWVFIKGGRTISETSIIQGIASHSAHVILPLSHLQPPSTVGKNQLVEKDRWQYCAAHGAMGGLCDESAPDPLPWPSAPPVERQWVLAGVKVVLTAGSRHQYLYHTLTTLLATPGAQQQNVLVVLGDAPSSTTRLLRLLSVNFIKLTVQGEGNSKLFRYYRSVFQVAARTFPDAPAVIFLDEDVEVSPDFFSFMSQTLGLLHADPTLYCVNSHSITGFSDRTFNPSRVFRGAVQVQWGYAVTPHFIKEALSKWPEVDHDTNIVIYDYWIYTHVRQGRECVYPEVSRSNHYGQGLNTDPLIAERVFLDKPLVLEAGVSLVGISRLKSADWRHDLSYNISSATPLLGNPCNADFIPKQNPKPQNNPQQLYVFYYRLDPTENGIPDVTQSFNLQNCVGGWSISEQGHHDGVSIVTLSVLNTLYLVGVPFSSYSHLRPQGLPLWDINTIPDEEYDMVEQNQLNRHKFTPIIANRNMTTSQLMTILSTP
ncbi:protein O-linked-mannose beta-1,2-N-acetylglucosaminyltransferase 1 [Procambarus clarkii]|uniref:protein O-linked-mannose beta-1,2-N-acetylglucosaminyltransferase 1 n=1 Tax=Procambarus clarkii TaxID=6728 RepID=UPI00374250F6